MASFSAGTTFTDGVANDVTAAKLAALVNAATPTSGLIQDRTSETAIAADDTLLFGDFSDSNNLKRMTVANFNNVVTTGTGTAAAPAIAPTGDTNTGVFFPAADTIAFSEGGAEAMRIDSSGNVLISSDAGDTLRYLDVQNTNSSANAGAILRLITRNVADSGNVAVDIVKYKTGGFTISNGEANAAAFTSFNVGTAERLRIDSSGNVLIGTTAVNPIASRSNGIATGPVGFVALRGPNNLGLALDSNSGSHCAFYTDNGSAYVNAGSITSTGNSTAYNTSSDYRLKTNLEPILNGIDRLKQLLVYRFNWISDIEGNKVDGFVAHEAQAIVPECVTGEKDAVDADGKPIYQGIDQSKIVPLLTAALKEAIAKIETLESKVTALEAA